MLLALAALTMEKLLWGVGILAAIVFLVGEFIHARTARIVLAILPLVAAAGIIYIGMKSSRNRAKPAESRFAIWKRQTENSLREREPLNHIELTPPKFRLNFSRGTGHEHEKALARQLATDAAEVLLFDGKDPAVQLNFTVDWEPSYELEFHPAKGVISEKVH